MSAIVRARVARYDCDVGALARLQRPDARALAEEIGAVLGLDVDRLERRESRLDEQLHLALIAEPGDGAAVAGRDRAPR